MHPFWGSFDSLMSASAPVHTKEVRAEFWCLPGDLGLLLMVPSAAGLGMLKELVPASPAQ